ERPLPGRSRRRAGIRLACRAGGRSVAGGRDGRARARGAWAGRPRAGRRRAVDPEPARRGAARLSGGARPVSALDGWLAHFAHGAPVPVVIGTAIVLGLRHASDPDHLVAVT